MDILILDSWLREHLQTNASPKDIARCLSLCGPSIEKVEKQESEGKIDYLYHIEVTTNRVDMMSVHGIAREASVILPEFGFEAKLLEVKQDKQIINFKNPPKLILKADPKLVDRLMGVILEVPKINSSPEWLQVRLESSGIRSLNNIVDITNYVMTEIGQPTHVFDYDLVKPFMGIRESKKGENVTSFDGKTYSLPGGDIVIESEKGQIIDLPGIIGTQNSVVNKNTKRILFFIDENNPVRIRKTSMTLGIKTLAATLNEKSVDPELATTALRRGLYLYKKIVKAKQISPIYDVYPNKPNVKAVKTSHKFLESLLGITIDSKKVLGILNSLEIRTFFDKKNRVYTSLPPTFRSRDITIPEDIVEEVARIYGYHNLPSKLMGGEIPDTEYDSPFDFEKKVKTILANLKGMEIYTLSLLPETKTEVKSLKLKNPLVKDAIFLRTSLKNSLISAAEENKGREEKFHFFEIANVYIPKTNALPDEKMQLSGIFHNYDFRTAKGILKALLDKLNIACELQAEEVPDFMPSQSLLIKSGGHELGEFGRLQISSFLYYQIDVEKLRKLYKEFPKYQPIPKFPPQVEDMTLVLPEKTRLNDVINKMKELNKLINNVELRDTYKDSYTFRVWYQSSEKTLDNSEVEIIRTSVIQALQKKFGASVK